MSLSGGTTLQVSQWLAIASYVASLTVYADFMAEDEGGKRAPLTRPIAQKDFADIPQASNVVQFRRRMG